MQDIFVFVTNYQEEDRENDMTNVSGLTGDGPLIIFR